MHRCFAALFALLIAAPAFAQEPVGCGKFKWPLDQEKASLASAKAVDSGAEVSQPLAAAVMLNLLPFAEAKLPAVPSRAPKSADSYAGFVRLPALAKPGTYRITLSKGAWIDVIQDEQALKSSAFSGATGCDAVAKSVKFDLASKPFVIELSGTSAHSVGLVVTQD